MHKKLQEVVELARNTLPLEERVALARELLAPRHEDEISEHDLRLLEREMNDRDNFISYDEVRRELELGPYAKGQKAARGR
jgi:hypothetical protein